jgi:hypothetical protein
MNKSEALKRVLSLPTLIDERIVHVVGVIVKNKFQKRDRSGKLGEVFLRLKIGGQGREARIWSELAAHIPPPPRVTSR